MNKYAKNKRGFAIMIALLVIMALAFVIFAYNTLVRSKAFETRHLAYNMKASKYAHAVAQFAAKKLQNAINQLNPDEMDDDVKNEIREKLISGNVTPGMQLAEGCTNLNNACTEFLKKLVKESDVDDNTIVIARVFSGDNNSLTPSEYFGAEVNLVVNEVNKLKDFVLDGNSEYFSDKEIYGTICVEVTVTVGHSQLKIKANESDNLISFPFKVVSCYPIGEKETECTLFAENVKLTTEKTDDWNKDPKLVLNNGGNGKIYLGIDEVIYACSANCSKTYGFVKSITNIQPKSVPLPNAICPSQTYQNRNVEFSFRYADWPVSVVYGARENFRKIIKDTGDSDAISIGNIEEKLYKKGPLWIALFGDDRNQKTKIYAKSKGADIVDRAISVGYLIDKNNNNELLAALPSSLNESDFKDESSAALIDSVYAESRTTTFITSRNDSLEFLKDLSEESYTLSKYCIDHIKNARTQYRDYSYMLLGNGKDGSGKPDFDEEYFKDVFGNIGGHMGYRVLYDFTKADDAEIKFQGDEFYPVIESKKFPEEYDGTVFSKGTIKNLNQSGNGRYFAISQSNQTKISDDNNAFVVAISPCSGNGASLNGGLACTSLDSSSFGNGSLKVTYDGKYNISENETSYCVAIGPIGAEP